MRCRRPSAQKVNRARIAVGSGENWRFVFQFRQHRQFPFGAAMTVNSQFIHRKRVAISRLCQQAGSIVPVADWFSFSIERTPLLPSNARKRIVIWVVRWHEHDRATHLCKPLDLLRRQFVRKVSLPDDHGRFLPIDFTNSIESDDFRFVG